MATFASDFQKVEAMKAGEVAYIGWFEEGGGEVHRIWDTWILFSIPQYGGNPTFEGTFNETQLAEMVKLVHSWT